MTKLSFLLSLHERLKTLPPEEVEERLRFYSEMIEDRMEEGLPEEEAVAAVGSIDEIVAQIIGEVPPAMPKKQEKRQHRTWEVVLLVLGSPIWFSLLIAAFAIAFSLYISLWAVAISLWAVFGSLCACAVAGIIAGVVFALSGHSLTGIAIIGAGFVCSGLSVFMFFCCKAATKGTLFLAQKTAFGIKNLFSKRGDA